MRLRSRQRLARTTSCPPVPLVDAGWSLISPDGFVESFRRRTLAPPLSPEPCLPRSLSSRSFRSMLDGLSSRSMASLFEGSSRSAAASRLRCRQSLACHACCRPVPTGRCSTVSRLPHAIIVCQPPSALPHASALARGLQRFACTARCPPVPTGSCRRPFDPLDGIIN